jgi:hypothetical protein
VARKEPARHNRFAARWLRCYLDEREGETLEEIAFVVGCLMALTSEEHELALGSLRSVTKGQRRG